MKTFDTRTFDVLLTNLGHIKDDLHKLQADSLPIKAGNLAVRHFKENFQLGGYQNGDLKPWMPTRRQLSGGRNAASQYGPLLSRQARLMGATRFEPGTNKVTIINDTPYARIHNEGGDISQNIPVTAKMRKFAWAKFFEAGGGKKGEETPEEAKVWRALALTKKTSISRTIHIPRRQFMGKAMEVVDAIRAMVVKEVNSLLKK
jgi:phage gpG-like protein